MALSAISPCWPNLAAIELQRTLARRLTAEGLSFSEILDQLRSDLAAHYLGDASLSISQIAWLVGYQGVSAFSHGCKRWTGMNPKRMRDKLLASR
jgi:AraC-like DNA-binding protein